MNTFLEYYSRYDKRINFHFIPLAHLDASNVRKTEVTTFDRYSGTGNIKIYELEIDGMKINVGGSFNGVGLSLRPGTYNVRVSFKMEHRLRIPGTAVDYNSKLIEKFIEREATVNIGDSGDCYLVLLAKIYAKWELQDVYKTDHVLFDSYNEGDYLRDSYTYKDLKYKLVACNEKYDLHASTLSSVNSLCRYWDLAEKKHLYGSYNSSDLNAYIKKRGPLHNSGTVIPEAKPTASAAAVKPAVSSPGAAKSTAGVTSVKSPAPQRTAPISGGAASSKPDLNKNTKTPEQMQEILNRVVDEARMREAKKPIFTMATEKINFSGYKSAIKMLAYAASSRNITKINADFYDFCRYNPYYRAARENGATLEEIEKKKFSIPSDYAASLMGTWTDDGDVFIGRDKYKGSSYNYGTYFSINGEVYEGEIKPEIYTKYIGSTKTYHFRCARNGKGRLFLTNGDVFEGEFLNGEPTGEGYYTPLGGEPFLCSYKLGKFVKYSPPKQTARSAPKKKASPKPKAELDDTALILIYEEVQSVMSSGVRSDVKYYDMAETLLSSKNAQGSVNKRKFDEAIELLRKLSINFAVVYDMNETLIQKGKAEFGDIGYYGKTSVDSVIVEGVFIGRSEMNDKKKAQNYGTVIYRDGALYEGAVMRIPEYSDDKTVLCGIEIERKGKGRLITSKGVVYEGEFSKNKLKGHCMMGDDKYVGNFVIDSHHGGRDDYELYNGVIYRSEGEIVKVKEGVEE